MASYEASREVLVKNLGCNLLGDILAAIVFGITTVQAVLYYSRFPKDRLGTRILIAVLLTLDLWTIIFHSVNLYHYIILRPGSVLALSDLFVWKVSVWQPTSTLQSLLVQGFFLHRIWDLTGNWWFTGLISFFSIAQAGLGFTVAIRWFIGSDHREFFAVYQPVMLTWYSVEIAADTSIAACMSWVLLKRRTGLIQTDTLLRKLSTYAAATGAITAVFSLVLIGVASTQYSVLIAIFGWPYGGIYTIAVLANLHSRTFIRRWEQNYESNDLPPNVPGMIELPTRKSVHHSRNSSGDDAHSEARGSTKFGSRNRPDVGLRIARPAYDVSKADASVMHLNEEFRSDPLNWREDSNGALRPRRNERLGMYR